MSFELERSVLKSYKNYKKNSLEASPTTVNEI